MRGKVYSFIFNVFVSMLIFGAYVWILIRFKYIFIKYVILEFWFVNKSFLKIFNIYYWYKIKFKEEKSFYNII